MSKPIQLTARIRIKSRTSDATLIVYCCTEMKQGISDGIVLTYGDSFYIRGEPDIVDDGDGHYEDMTSRIEIQYCPFCGEKLNK